MTQAHAHTSAVSQPTSNPSPIEILKFDQLAQGGFAGLRERQFVTDARVFGERKKPAAFNGLGNFVYLADANFTPKGETGMHGHKEIDVISVMVDGRIAHAGSLEHGQGLSAGSTQVQRAGAEGFKHNEVNPDPRENHMIQLWVLPDAPGEQAGYKVYEPNVGEMTQVYGGVRQQDPDDQATFHSRTGISVANGLAGQNFSLPGKVMAYLSKGQGTVNGQAIAARTLVRGEDGIDFIAASDAQIIFIFEI